MSIATQITRLNNNIEAMKTTKQEIKDAMNNDFDIIANEQIEDYAELIEDGLELYKDYIPSEVTNQATEISVNDAMKYSRNKLELFGNTEQATSILPDTYTQVDYIESTGTQYIDTGINADSNLRTLLDIVYTNPSGSNQNIGAIRLQTSASGVRYHLLPQSGKIRFYTNNSGLDTIDIDTNRHVYDMDVPNRKIIVDSTEYEKPGSDFDVGLNFYLFGRNSTSTIYLTNMKLYKCKMWYNNVLVRDYVPCKDSNNVVGLYDLVSQTFFGNDGTGDFVAGNEVSIPNPDYPQDIHVVSGNNTIGVTGANVFDGIMEVGSISTTTGKNTAATNAIRSVNYIPINNLNYSLISRDVFLDNHAIGIRYYDSNYNFLSTTSIATFTNYTSITAPNNTAYIRFVDTSAQGDITEKFAIRTDGKTSYEQYTHQDYPLNLGNIELCKIGDYQDYLYKENGNWYKYGAIRKYNECISSSVQSTTYRCLLKHRNELHDMSSTTNILANGMSKNTDVSANASVVYRSMIRYNYGWVGLNIVYNTEIGNFETGTEVKNWFNNNEVVYVVINTSVDDIDITQITDETLITQLEAIYENLQLTKGTNHITVTASDLKPYMKLSYKNYESNLTNE